jgi:hypothetical protein
MNPQKKVTIQQQAEETQQAHQQTAGSDAIEFATVDELLRHDASHTPVPPEIEQRLEKSISPLPAAQRRAWWRRIFGD